MSMEQKDIGPLGIKFLKLVSPEKGEELGIPAEAPFFVDGGGRCPVMDCGFKFPWQVYQTDDLVTALHLEHKYSSGGIIYSGIREKMKTTAEILKEKFYGSGIIINAEAMSMYGWLAFVHGLGILENIHGGSLGFDFIRTEQIVVDGIQAYCHPCSLPKMTSAHTIESYGIMLPLDHGFVSLTQRRNLVAVCDLNKHPEYAESVPYTFEAFDQSVVAFQMQQPGTIWHLKGGQIT